MALNSLGELENAPGAAHRERAACKRDLLTSRLEAAKGYKSTAVAFRLAAETQYDLASIHDQEGTNYINLPKAWRDSIYAHGSFDFLKSRESVRAHNEQCAQHLRSVDESLQKAREFNSMKTNMGLRFEIAKHDLMATAQTLFASFGIK